MSLEVRAAVRESFGELWEIVAKIDGFDAIQVKTFMAYGMLLNTNAALPDSEIRANRARQAMTRINTPRLFKHLPVEANQ